MKHKLFYSAFFCLCLLAQSAQAQIASIKVGADSKSESTIEVGEIARLEATILEQPDTTIVCQWRLTNPPEIYDIEKNTEDEGKKIYFASNVPGSYKFELITVVVTEAGKNVKIDWLQHTVKVVGLIPHPDPTPSPTPTPDPDPDPSPTPTPIPAPSFGLVEFVVGVSADLPSTEGSEALSKAWESVAGRIGSGSIKNAAQAQEALLQAARSALTKEQKPNWAPFFSAVGKRINELKASGKFSDFSNYRLACLEVAKGLRSLK